MGNDSLEYENLVFYTEIPRVQCVSMTTYERTFLVQNCSNTKHRNKMLTKNLETVLRVVLDGPIQGCHDILMKQWRSGKTTQN